MSDHGAAHGDDHGGHAAEHGGHGHGPEIWETSIWPVIAAIAAVVTGLSLVWVARDSGNDFAGPIAGAALAATVLAVVAWIWERRKKDEEQARGLNIDVPDPKYTQVLTFTLVPGQLVAARAADGVIHQMEATDLGEIEGFQDFRITISPAEDGPSQVLVETTWANRDGLAGYNASRQNLLDIVARHEDVILPGSVQAFDMEVVRDTKQQSYRFGMGTALTILGGLIAGGFMFGAAQTLFQEEAVIADGPGPVENPYEILARDNNTFDKTTLTAPPNTEVTYTMNNEGLQLHNLAFYDAPGGTQIATTGSPDRELQHTVTFTTPGPGSYYFQCDAHPTQMNGTFLVEEGAPPPGGAAPPTGGEGEEGGEEGEGDGTEGEAEEGDDEEEAE